METIRPPEGLYKITIVRARSFVDMLKAADDGDQKARYILLAFGRWSREVAVAEAKNGAKPACFSCQKILEPSTDGGEGIGGIAVAAPKDRSATVLVAAYCPACDAFDQNHLLNALNGTIQDEIGVLGERVQ